MHQTLITLTKHNFGVYVVFMINLDQILWPTLHFLQFAEGNDACYTLECNTKSIKKEHQTARSSQEQGIHSFLIRI